MTQREVTVHDFVGVDSGDVYDQTQTDDAIKDGDVLNLGYGNVAILLEAWPTVFSGKIDRFHRLDAGFSFETLDDGKYAASAAKARELLQAQSLRLFADEAGNLVQVLETSTPETVEFSVQGGGFVHTTPRAEFEHRFKPATLPALSLTAVSADWLPDDMAVPAHSEVVAPAMSSRRSALSAQMLPNWLAWKSRPWPSVAKARWLPSIPLFLIAWRPKPPARIGSLLSRATTRAAAGWVRCGFRRSAGVTDRRCR